jgi:hypothetical protein
MNYRWDSNTKKWIYPIEQMAKTSPGVGSVSELESKFGHIVYPQPTANVPGMSQSAIAEAAKIPPVSMLRQQRSCLFTKHRC